MSRELIHRFELNGRRFAIDPESCFCFECDEISWDVLEYYPEKTINFLYHKLGGKHDVKELTEVVGELEWLRATKSILSHAKREDYLKKFDFEGGVRRLTVRLPDETEKAPAARKRSWFGAEAVREAPDNARAVGQDALHLLLARAQRQPALELRFLETTRVRFPDLLVELGEEALRMAALSGKRVQLVVQVDEVSVSGAPPALEGHSLGLRLECRDAESLKQGVKDLAGLREESLARLAKRLPATSANARGVATLTPGHAKFGGAVQALREAGFGDIELDLDGAFIAHPELEPAAVLPSINEAAVYYAQRLLEGKTFRLDPIAEIFWHVHEGSPRPRRDPIGTNELAVDGGGIYPSARFLGDETFRLGDARAGTLDEMHLAEFDKVGSLTTAACRGCWVRNLCGGGCAAVHHRLNGSIRTPHEPWCELQRAWMAGAVSAFNVLSSHGVNFTRMYQSIANPDSGGSGMKLLAKVRAAFSMAISMRLLEESDAEWLVKWENWSDASYFLFNESGLLLATQYDREMDTLHPQRVEREMVVTRRRDGEPIGLLKLRPERISGIAAGWVYLHPTALYGSDEVRKGVRFLLEQAGAQQDIRRFLIYAAEYEQDLQEFLKATGFRHAGVLREALYLHGVYRDVRVFEIVFNS